MNEKRCSQCKKQKSYACFSNNKNNKDGKRNHCKKCDKLNRKLYKEKYPWKITHNNIKARCNDSKFKQYKDYGGRGIKCLITKDEIKKLWFRDEAWLLKQPSIDREDNDGHYTLDNCRFIEQNKNSIIGNSKTIYQYSLQGKLIKIWKSAMEVKKELNFDDSFIRKTCLGKFKKAHGFIWRSHYAT